MLGFDEVLSPGVACEETFALLDGSLMLSTWPSRWKLRTRGRVRSLGALLTFCSFVVVSPDVADEEMLALLDSCSGLTRSSRRASRVTRRSRSWTAYSRSASTRPSRWKLCTKSRVCSLGALLALGSLVVVLPDVADEETLAFSDARSVSTRSLHWAMTAVAEARAAAARTAAQRLTCHPVAGTRLPLLLPTESLEDVQHHCEQDGRIQRQAARGSQQGFVTGVAWERASVIQTEAVW